MVHKKKWEPLSFCPQIRSQIQDLGSIIIPGLIFDPGIEQVLLKNDTGIKKVPSSLSFSYSAAQTQTQAQALRLPLQCAESHDTYMRSPRTLILTRVRVR